MSRLSDTEVIKINRLTDREFILRLRLPHDAQPPLPGQFYLLKTQCSYDPLLRRPFSAFRWEAEWIEFLIRKTGRGTSLLATLSPGESINLFGPLGRPFPRPASGKTPVVIAGGIGLASVYSIPLSYDSDFTLIYGARTVSELLLTEELGSLFKSLHLCTDDGSRGFQGSVVDFFINFFENVSPESIVVYSCGPEAMMGALLKIMKERDIDGFFSLEERMACGLGACMGCAKKTSKGMKRVCMEGPVFHTEEL